MQHVKASWLRIFNYGLVAFSGLLFANYLIFNLLGVSDQTQQRWGVDSTILLLCLGHAIFVLLSDKFMMKKSPLMTTVISIGIYSAIFAALIEYTGNNNIVYRLSYVLFVFFNPMSGFFVTSVSVIVTWLLLIFTLVGIATPTQASLQFNVFINMLMTLAALIGWLTFRRHYVSTAKESLLESKIEEEQFKSSAILESITDGVLVVSNNKLIQIANNSAAQMLGVVQQDALNKDYGSLLRPLPDDDKTAVDQIDAITQAFEKQESVQVLSKLDRPSGKSLYVDIIASPIYQNVTNLDGQQQSKMTGVIAVLRDVDKQKRAEQQRSDFISTASHEMRTPLASVQGYLELALNPKLSTVDDRGQNYLKKAHAASAELGSLFQDLLTISQNEDGRLSNNPVVFNVIEFAKSIATQGRISAENNGSTVSFVDNISGIEDAEIFVDIDPDRLKQVLINLIDNAYKYTKEGSVSFGLDVDQDTVTFRISDTGMGIVKEDQAHIFQKFYRVDNSQTREIGGTGLGLFICKQIVEMMRGRIWVDSELGAGSTFFVQVPRISSEGVVSVTGPDSEPNN
jgi:PAS domain S-box-containing protein